MTPAASIVVPVYNVAEYLPAALASLQAQTRGDWEAVCVDDGSTDGSGEILEDFAARDGRFRVVRRGHAGVSAARNAALERATGEAILFLDPDDTVAPDWLERMLAPLAACDWVLAGFRQDGETFASRDVGTSYSGEALRRRVWRAFFGYRLRDLVGLVWPGGLWKFAGREMAGVWRCALKRGKYGGVRFDEELRLCEDAMYLSRLALKPGTMSVVGDCGYCWNIRTGGAMLQEGRERLVANKFAVREARKTLDPGREWWRGSFVLSALAVFRASRSPRVFLRYVSGTRASAPRWRR